MGFFEQYFELVEDTGEAAVCCPFDHFTGDGTPYQESNPSAHINLSEDKRLFHCKVCGTGNNEIQFIQYVLKCSTLDARILQKIYEHEESLAMWQRQAPLNDYTRAKVQALGVSPEVIAELHISSDPSNSEGILFPVFMYDQLLDIRKYLPEGTPKVKSRANSMAGLIIPFDVWREANPNRVTLVCAGEKDMAIARSNGFNAITITGGEMALPGTPALFKDRRLAIVYDNDGAGMKGAKKLASYLLEYTSDIRVVTNFHEVCIEKGEDITDFFTKYNKTREDLIKYIEETPIYVPSPEDEARRCPVIDLLTASEPKHLNKMVQSNIQVVAVADTAFTIPTAIWGEKFKATDGGDTMAQGEYRNWELNENTVKDVLHLMDNNFTEEIIKKNIKDILKIPHKERCVSIKHLAKETVFKAQVTDLFETNNTNVMAMEYTAYSLGQKLESGKKYLITYKLVPHPYKGQQLVMLILKAVQANDSVSNFVITPEVKRNLDVVRSLEGSVEERINTITEKFKGLVGYNGNNLLIQTLEFAYHTVIEFDFGTFKGVRGYLDTLVVGESRMGKSSTAETMRTTYGLGTFTSLAGASATIAGLIGGSNKTSSGGFQTRAGVIPQNHKGLIIFEELSKCNSNVIAELTDIRSSNQVRITRVSGTVCLPAMVRMITLSNVKSGNGVIKPIASYPNGISVVIELINSAEDIARYDLLVVLSDRGASQIDPFWQPETPFDTEVYRTRVRWVWSRKPEQIIISREVGLYVMEVANAINQQYDSHVKIFGTEAWKKITRLAIAIAGTLVSTDSEYNNIIVDKEHVDYAVNFYKRLYDNPTFKLREYVEHERQYSQIDEHGVQNLQDIYNQHPGLVLQLEQCSAASRNVLGASTGLGNDDLNKAMVRLTKGLFIKFEQHDIIPTERFRLGLARINKNTHPRRVGE